VVDELLEPVRNVAGTHHASLWSAKECPAAEPASRQIDEPWCGTRQPNTTPTRHFNAAAHNNNDNTTSTNP
jgi:hypothetical protein